MGHGWKIRPRMRMRLRAARNSNQNHSVKLISHGGQRRGEVPPREPSHNPTKDGSSWASLTGDIQVMIVAGEVLRREPSHNPTKEGSSWASLPRDIQDMIVAFLPLEDLIRFLEVCQAFRDVTLRRTFQHVRLRLYPKEFRLSPLIFSVEGGHWHMIGFDITKVKDMSTRRQWLENGEIEENGENQNNGGKGKWRKMPPLKCLPSPDPELFKDFLVAGGVGIFCVDVGKFPDAEKLIICNPLTQETRELPPLNFRRHPVVVHVHVNLASNSYLVMVAGSSGIGTEALSRKTEVYDSVLKKWVVVGDVPGPEFALNEYQNGAYCKNMLFCVGFLSGGGKGVLAFNLEKGAWLENWKCPLPQAPGNETEQSTYFAITQLLESNDKIYLFTEQEPHTRVVDHCIHELDLDFTGVGKWTRVMKESRKGNRALLVYPEYTCVPHGENKLCIFNTIEHTGVVYEIVDAKVATKEPLPPPPPNQSGLMFHSLNPIGFAFEPSFGVSV